MFKLISEPAPEAVPGPRYPHRPAFTRAAGPADGESTRLGLVILAVAGGYLIARVSGIGDLSRSSGYLYAATSLLAVGLYGSCYAIDLDEARRSASTVVSAVTLGVLGKSLLISGITFVLFRQPIYLVLGVAVAQIDPLSVAIMNRSSSMSPRAKSVLAAWAAFDDPVTVIITVYAATFARQLQGGEAGAGSAILGHAGAVGYLSSIGENLAFAGLVGALVVLVRQISRRRATVPDTPDSPLSTTRRRRSRAGAAIGVLLVLLAVGVWQFWMLGLAVIALLYRPAQVAVWLERAVGSAFGLAAFALGIFLAGGIDLPHGIALGVITFAAQAGVSLPLTRKLKRSDRVQLALAQQNGVTAILLALLLQPLFPQATAIVGPAILTVNLLHLISRAFLARQPGTS